MGERICERDELSGVKCRGRGDESEIGDCDEVICVG